MLWDEPLGIQIKSYTNVLDIYLSTPPMVIKNHQEGELYF